MEALSVDQTCLILGGSCMCDTECIIIIIIIIKTLSSS